MEFTKSKYNSEKDYKKNIDNYLESKKFTLNKYCLDMCMKNGNYDAGIYLIEKYKIKPDLYTSIFIKDMQKRILFYNSYFNYIYFPNDTNK